MPLRLGLLAKPHIVVDGTEQFIPLNKPSSLLFHLAYRADWVSRSELAFLYRSDVPEAVALNYLRKLIFRARKYPWAKDLEVTETHLRWLIESDAKAFRQAFQGQNWQEALSLYQNNLLANASLDDSPAYTAWLELERSDLDRQYRTAQQKRVAELETTGQFSEALLLVSDLRKLDPLDEAILQTHLQLLIKDNRQKEALALYDLFGEQLKTELDAEPLESTQLLIDSISQKVSSAFVIEVKPRHNLPAQTTRFVGRKQELKELHETLKNPNCRLLTLLGLGGTGKTRLTLEFARSVMNDYKDGVWFVSLAGVLSSEAIVPTIAEQLGLTLEGSTDLREQLIDYLVGQKLLLILDNFEHLLGHSSLLEEILLKAPQLDILVTSREALQQKSEWLFDLTGLHYPAKHEKATASFEAIDLFIQRASRVSSQFVITEEALEAIAEICRLVEGMPLALELAATWVRSLSVKALAEELKQSIELLEASPSAKYKGIKSVFDYVWQGLSLKEQMALSKLAVFQGGFDLNAAKEVSGAHLSMLMLLVNRSLIRRNAQGRYSIHELIRQYARLQPSTDDFERAHADYFIKLLYTQKKAIQSSDATQVIKLIDLDFENIMQAWNYVTKQLDIEALTKALEPLYYYFYYKGYYPFAVDNFTKLQEKLPDDASLLKAKLLARTALFQRNLGQMQAAKHSLEKALELVKQTNDRAEESNILCEYGKWHHLMSDYKQAETLYLEAVELARASGNSYIEASAIMALGDLTYYLNANLKEAVQHYEQSLRLFRQLGEQDGINAALLNLGAAAFDRHDVQTAKHYYEEAHKVINQLGQSHREGIVLSNLAAIAMHEDDTEKAQAYLQKSLDIRWQTSDKRGAAETLNQLAKLAYQQKQFQEACKKHRKALMLFQELSDLSGLAYTKSHYARALLSCGQKDHAKRTAQEALELAWDIRKHIDILSALLSFALVSEDTQKQAILVHLVVQEAKGNHEIIRKEAEQFLEVLELSLIPKQELPDLKDAIKSLLA